MEAHEHKRLSMLTILHATGETALDMLGGGNADMALVADLKRLLEQTRRELDTLACGET